MEDRRIADLLILPACIVGLVTTANAQQPSSVPATPQGVFAVSFIPGSHDVAGIESSGMCGEDAHFRAAHETAGNVM